MTDFPPAIFLMGPTASGKSDLALKLCEVLPCEIVSVDSAQVYRGMDIGTAKPSAEERAEVPHHLLDICDPAHAYSAAQFCADALAVMTDITARGKIPLLTGGTMLYFRALLDGLADMPPSDPVVRAQVEALAKEHGWPHIHALLAAVDPETAAELHPNHSQRIQRAYEVWCMTGTTMSSLRAQQVARVLPWHVVQLALVPEDRQQLHQRIAQRFEVMLANGLEAEVLQLYQRGDLHPDLPSVRSVGYRQLWDFHAGDTSREQAIDLAVIATRQLAKRQYTWLRKWPEMHCLEAVLPAVSEKLCEEALKTLAEGGISSR